MKNEITMWFSYDKIMQLLKDFALLVYFIKYKPPISEECSFTKLFKNLFFPRRFGFPIALA